MKKKISLSFSATVICVCFVCGSTRAEHIIYITDSWTGASSLMNQEIRSPIPSPQEVILEYKSFMHLGSCRSVAPSCKTFLFQTFSSKLCKVPINYLKKQFMISLGNEMGLFFNNPKYLRVIRSLMILSSIVFLPTLFCTLTY